MVWVTGIQNPVCGEVQATTAPWIKVWWFVFFCVFFFYVKRMSYIIGLRSGKDGLVFFGFFLNVKRMSYIIVTFFCIKLDHNLSLTLTKCCECLNKTIKTKAIVTGSAYFLAGSNILVENKPVVWLFYWYFQYYCIFYLWNTYKNMFVI